MRKKKKSIKITNDSKIFELQKKTKTKTQNINKKKRLFFILTK